MPRARYALLALSLMVPSALSAQPRSPRVSLGIFAEPNVGDWLSAHLPELQACAADAEGPMLPGFIHFALSVSPTGELDEIRIESDDVQNRGFASCAEHIVRGVPLEGRGRPAVVHIPIRVER